MNLAGTGRVYVCVCAAASMLVTLCIDPSLTYMSLLWLGQFFFFLARKKNGCENLFAPWKSATAAAFGSCQRLCHHTTIIIVVVVRYNDTIVVVDSLPKESVVAGPDGRKQQWSLGNGAE